MRAAWEAREYLNDSGSNRAGARNRSAARRQAAQDVLRLEGWARMPGRKRSLRTGAAADCASSCQGVADEAELVGDSLAPAEQKGCHRLDP
eukprot:2222360-Prymnesium_polylepis.2